MGRKAVPQPLALGGSGSVRPSDDSRVGETAAPTPNSARPPPDTASPASPRSPRSPFRFGQKKPESAGASLQLADVLSQPQSAQHPEHQQQQQPEPRPIVDPASSVPSPRGRPTGQHQQQPPQLGHRHARHDEDKASKSGFFFNFGKATKSSDRPVANQHSDLRAETMSTDSDPVVLAKQSTKHSGTPIPPFPSSWSTLRECLPAPPLALRPDAHSPRPGLLVLRSTNCITCRFTDASHHDSPLNKPNAPQPSRSEVSLASSADYDGVGNPASHSKKNKPKPFNLLGRTRSIKDKDSKDSPSPKEHIPPPVKAAEPERQYTSAQPPLKTAPLQAHDRSFREMMSSAVRNHSAERSQARDVGGKGRDQENHHRGLPSSFREASGSAFFSNLKHSKAAGILSNRFFGGSSRSESAPPKEPVVDDEHYVLKVINLPLVEQTRLTRISKRLEDSRDKTEFWMPAFPWRAIDYLNYKGSDVEGLYRVPGSGPQIKKWQRKFDEGNTAAKLSKDTYTLSLRSNEC